MEVVLMARQREVVLVHLRYQHLVLSRKMQLVLLGRVTAKLLERPQLHPQLERILLLLIDHKTLPHHIQAALARAEEEPVYRHGSWRLGRRVRSPLTERKKKLWQVERSQKLVLRRFRLCCNIGRSFSCLNSCAKPYLTQLFFT